MLGYTNQTLALYNDVNPESITSRNKALNRDFNKLKLKYLQPAGKFDSKLIYLFFKYKIENEIILSIRNRNLRNLKELIYLSKLNNETNINLNKIIFNYFYNSLMRMAYSKIIKK